MITSRVSELKHFVELAGEDTTQLCLPLDDTLEYSGYTGYGIGWLASWGVNARSAVQHECSYQGDCQSQPG